MPRKKKQPTSPPPAGHKDDSFIPGSYWQNCSVEQTITGSICGVARRETVEQALAEGTLEQLPDFLLQDRLSEQQQQLLSSIHPSLMGGEYLPDQRPGELTIASICYVGAVCRDVDEIRASLRGGYRWVGESWEGREIDEDKWVHDEEKGETKDTLPPINYCLEVSRNELADWIVERVMEVLYDNHYNGGEAWEDLLGFASVSSNYYPGLGKHCDELIGKAVWDCARHDYQSKRIKDLTETLESEVTGLEESYIEVMTEPGKSDTPQFRKRRAKIEADYGRAALFLRLLKPNPGRYWEVFGPWSDVDLH